MLAPVSEAEFGERALLELGLESARRYAAFCAELDDPGYRAVGTLVVARDRDEAEALDRLAAFRARARACRSSGCARRRPARLEPALAPTIRLALDIDGRPLDRPAQARRRAAAARSPASCAAPASTGADASRASASPASSPTAARSPPTRSSSPPACTSRGSSMPEHARVPVRPVKGQVLRLRDPSGPGLVERTIRGEQRVPRPPRRRPLRARRDDGGARLGHDADRGRRLRAAARPERDRPGRLRARDRGADRRACARRRPTTCRRSARARSRAWSGRPATSATASCSRRSPPTSSPARWPASRCPDWAAPADPLRFAGVPRMKVVSNGERRRARRRRDGRRPRSTSLDLPGAGRGVAVAVDAEVVPRGAVGADRVARRGAGGDPARDPGRLRWPSPTPDRRPDHRAATSCARGCCSAPAGSARSTRSPPRWRRPARELVTVALRRIDPAPARLDRRRARPRRRPAAAQHRRLLHRARRRADRQAGPRGVRDRLGQARGDRRRAHAAARRAGAARGRRGARRRRLRRAPVHERRPDPRAPAGGRRLRGGDAARLADRLRHGPAEHRTTCA